MLTNILIKSLHLFFTVPELLNHSHEINNDQVIM